MKHHASEYLLTHGQIPSRSRVPHRKALRHRSMMLTDFLPTSSQDVRSFKQHLPSIFKCIKQMPPQILLLSASIHTDAGTDPTSQCSNTGRRKRRAHSVSCGDADSSLQDFLPATVTEECRAIQMSGPSRSTRRRVSNDQTDAMTETASQCLDPHMDDRIDPTSQFLDAQTHVATNLTSEHFNPHTNARTDPTSQCSNTGRRKRREHSVFRRDGPSRSTRRRVSNDQTDAMTETSSQCSDPHMDDRTDPTSQCPSRHKLIGFSEEFLDCSPMEGLFVRRSQVGFLWFSGGGDRPATQVHYRVPATCT